MKNLANFKISVKTREYLIQAIFQFLFNSQATSEIINQFKQEHKSKKGDFKMFCSSLKSIEKNKFKIEEVIKELDIKSSSIELIDKSILFFAVVKRSP